MLNTHIVLTGLLMAKAGWILIFISILLFAGLGVYKFINHAKDDEDPLK